MFDKGMLDEIREALPIEDVAGRYVQLKRVGPEYRGLSPFNAERSPSFYAVPRKRMFHDFSSGNSGDVFALVMLLEGWDFRQAVEECAKDAGISLPGRATETDPARRAEWQRRRAEQSARWRAQQQIREAEESRRQVSVREMARELWKESAPICGTPAEAYLRGRGIHGGERYKALRYHPALEHRSPDDGVVTRWPALVAAVQSPEATFLALWRIYLDPLGNKAPVRNGKLGLASYTDAGGAVRLGTPGAVAHVCEGIETGLGVVGITGGRECVYAALSTSGMVNFVPPAGTERTLIWPDGDVDKIKVDRKTGTERKTESPGMRAASVLATRLKDEGRKVSVQPTPKTGRDYLDVYNAARGKLTDEDTLGQCGT